MSFEVGLAIILMLFPFGWEMMGFPHVRIVGVLSWAACLGILAHLTLKSVWFQRKFERYPRFVSAVLGSLVTLVICGMLVGWYWYHVSVPREVTITISAYQPQYPAPIQVVKDQKFEDQDIPLDGYDYDHVTFKNVCFLYDGGSYQLQSVTIQKPMHICVKDDRLKNYQALMRAFDFFDPRIDTTSRTVMKPR